jgi:hypothetical protein
MVRPTRRSVRVLAALMAAVAICGQAAAASKYVLLAEPPVAHPGDTIYLSGSGFPPRTALTIVSVCTDRTPGTNRQISIGAAGPTTNRAGQLIGARFQLPMFPDGVALTCRYYPSFSGQGMSFSGQGKKDVAPAVQNIAPSSTTIDPHKSDPTITFRLTRSGSTWSLHLSSWPGAQLRAEIAYFPSGKAQHVVRTLGWRGRITLPVPKHAFQGKGSSPGIRVFASSEFAGHIGSIATCQQIKLKTGATLGDCT